MYVSNTMLVRNDCRRHMRDIAPLMNNNRYGTRAPLNELEIERSPDEICRKIKISSILDHVSCRDESECQDTLVCQCE